MALKHVGRVTASRRKVVVAYRVVPDEPENCVVIQTENLSADEHDSLIMAVESAAGQEAEEFNKMIADQKGVTVGDLAMRSTPAQSAEPEGNVDAVAQYTGETTETSLANEGVLTDTDMAKQYRSQADRLSKEAAELRRQAEALVPTKKKAKTKESA